jgi:hypothetical protein
MDVALQDDALGLQVAVVVYPVIEMHLRTA